MQTKMHRIEIFLKIFYRTALTQNMDNPSFLREESHQHMKMIFFDKTKTPIIDPVMTPVKLLEKYSRTKDFCNFICFGDGCSKSFIFEGSSF
jgi:hypothetical protein